MPSPPTTPVRVEQPLASPPTPATMLNTAMDWKSVVRSHKLTLEHAAVDIDTDRVLYHMELELASPLPAGMGQPGQFLCLTWPYGGLWKIERVTDNNKKVKCLSWRKTDMQQHEVLDLAKHADALAKKAEAGLTTEAPAPGPVTGDTVAVVDSTPDPFPTLFEWKMMRGEWGSDATHWFIRDVEPPVQPNASNLKRKLIAKLFVGFDPLEASIEINAVTSIDTVAQTYAADVTWQVKLPAVTALREDSVLREFLDLLEINAEHFEFTNVAEIQDLRDLTSSLVPAGDAEFKDLTLIDDRAVLEEVYHLVFRRRVCATFTEEMALHSFPFDQQKLMFEFSTGSGMPDGSVFLAPAPLEPGSFSIENYQLGNVYDVLYHNKVFVSFIQESGPKKFVDFEMVLERRSGYYLTNVAIIAAVITYLCFVTYAPQEDGTLMDMGSRLQVVTALVLTAVTFKNQVAELIPQVSYFTMLDSYVFFCFIISSLVTIENALFPVVQSHLKSWNLSENGLLAFSIGSFTLTNIVWALYVVWWLKRRRHGSRVLMQVHQYVREITKVIPAKYRADVLNRFLDAKKFEDWCRPKFLVTSAGDIHVLAPDDVPPEDAQTKADRLASAAKQEQLARSEVAEFKKIYLEMRPGLDRRASAPITTKPNASPTSRLTSQSNKQGSLEYGSAAGTDMGGRRAVSDNRYFQETVVNVDPFRRHRNSDARSTSSRRAV